MGDDSEATFEKRLDLLISEYRGKMEVCEIAGSLFATANGVLKLEEPQTSWDAESRVLAVPYRDAATLEGSLHDFLTLKATCVRVNGEIPSLADVTLRIVAGSRSVDIPARMVQNTPAGVVLKIQNVDVAVQRDLVGLPAALRSQPTAKAAVNTKAVRIPNITDPADIPSPSPTPTSLVQLPTPEPASEPPPAADCGDERPTPARESLRVMQIREELEVVETRARSKSHFEALGIHFTALPHEIDEAWERVSRLTALDSDEAVDDALRHRLAHVRGRCREAHDVLTNERKRQEHRKAVVDPFQIESVLDMYEKQADTAKLRREIPAAVEAYERMVELKPNDGEVRHQLAALRALL